MAKLFISENGRDAVYELFDDTPEVTVGRGAANAVQIADSHASKVHFVLRRMRERWKLIDLESKNGTKVNGAFRNGHWLAHGDAVTVGAVALRFDAEGEASGAPPRSAVPVAAAPVRVALAEAPIAAAPVVSRSAGARPAVPVTAPAAPPPRPQAAPVTSRGAPSRRGTRDDEGDEEEERPRFARKQGMGGGVVALLLVVGVGAVALLISLLMTGDNPNSVLRNEVRLLREQRRYAEAIALIDERARDGEPGFAALRKERAELQAQIAMEAEMARNSEAQAAFVKNISYRIAAGKLRPKGHPSDREAAQILRSFLAEYGDTMVAVALVNDTVGTNVDYQRIMRENQDASRTEKTAWTEAEAAISSAENGGRYGKAFARLTFALQSERLHLSAENLARFEARVNERQEALRQRAKAALQRSLDEGEVLARGGDKEPAKAAVRAILAMIGWPDAELVRLAEEKMRAW